MRLSPKLIDLRGSVGKHGGGSSSFMYAAGAADPGEARCLGTGF